MKKILPILFMTLAAVMTGCSGTKEGGEPETKKFTVTFESNGGSAVEAQLVAEGGMATRPLPPTKEGAAFENWYKDQALATVYDFNTPVTKDITVYAKWTAIDREALQKLVNESAAINQNKYTQESYDAMRLKQMAAQEVLNNASATKEQIEKAYNELSAAIKALVAIPYTATTKLFVDARINGGMLYITPDNNFYIYAYGHDDMGNNSTNDKVTFACPGLEAWVDEAGLQTTDNSLVFKTKSELTPGATLTMTIASAEFPTIKQTFTLKVVGPEDAKVMFLNKANSLPDPSNISYEHYDLLEEAASLYYLLPYEMQQETAVQMAYNKLNDCREAYYDLPERMFYSFNGNVCTMLQKDYNEESKFDFTFTANGAFPAGSYESVLWMPGEKNGFYQMKLTLNADKSLAIYERTAKDATGANPSAWEKTSTGTYTFTGDKANGGIFYLVIEYDDPEIIDPEIKPVFGNFGR